jgi:hypothetical protein
MEKAQIQQICHWFETTLPCPLIGRAINGKLRFEGDESSEYFEDES